MELRRGRRISASMTVLGATAAALVLSLAACASDAGPETPSEASSSSAAPSEDPADPGVVSQEADDDLRAFVNLPPGFPREEVPLDEEAVTAAERTEYDGVVAYTVIVDSAAEPPDAVTGGAQELTDGGLEGDMPQPGGTGPLTFRNEDRSLVVVLTGARVRPGSLLTYTVEVGQAG